MTKSPARSLHRTLAAAMLATVSACTANPATVATPAPAAVAAERRTPVTILISIDGFRPDYLERGVTPVLNRLRADGVFSAMRPSFPSKTFPNHWAMVTGLRPDRSGIVANNMTDPGQPGSTFTMATDDPVWWNAAPPVWVDAEGAGIRTATMFWPGANVAWGGARQTAWPHDVVGGTRPEDWAQYNEAITSDQRVDGVLDWLRRPAATRPRFVTLYFDTVDIAGHRYGPDDPHMTQAVAGIDTAVGRLVEGLAALGRPANLVIVSDHGMAATSRQRVIPLAELAPAGDYVKREDGVYASLDPAPGREAALAHALARPHAHVRCWPKAQIPARFHYGHNPRIPAFLCLADPGWLILQTPSDDDHEGGNHGYDNDMPSMRALFIANGPAFAAGRTLPTFDNVDVDPLLHDLLGLAPNAVSDGTDVPFRGVLK